MNTNIFGRPTRRSFLKRSGQTVFALTIMDLVATPAKLHAIGEQCGANQEYGTPDEACHGGEAAYDNDENCGTHKDDAGKPTWDNDESCSGSQTDESCRSSGGATGHEEDQSCANANTRDEGCSSGDQDNNCGSNDHDEACSGSDTDNSCSVTSEQDEGCGGSSDFDDNCGTNNDQDQGCSKQNGVDADQNCSFQDRDPDENCGITPVGGTLDQDQSCGLNGVEDQNTPTPPIP